MENLSILEAKNLLVQAIRNNKGDVIEQIRGVRKMLEELSKHASLPDVIPEARSEIQKLNAIFNTKLAKKKASGQIKTEEKKKFIVKLLEEKDGMFYTELTNLAAKHFGSKKTSTYLSVPLADSSKFKLVKDNGRKRVFLVR